MGRDRGARWGTREQRRTRVVAAVMLVVPLAAVSLPATAGTGPVFVQQTSGRVHSGSLALPLPQAVTLGDRLVVEVGIWSIGGATAKSVTDSAGNTWTRLTATLASDHTQLSSWTAPVTAGGGTKPTVTVTATGTANIGVGVLDYSGVSTVTGAGVVDVSRTATGATGGTPITVATGATSATTAGPEVAIGMYADSGFGDTLTAGPGWTQRVNVSPTGDMEFLAEDQVVNAGATPSATFGTGPNTPWLAAILVLKSATTAPTAPAAPTAVVATTTSSTSATVSWGVPADGGSPITSYTVTPYAGAVAQAPVTVIGTPPSPSAAVTGLTTGVSYTFTVTATNAIGTSPASAPSNAIVPGQVSQGQWGPLQTWPIVAINAILLANGKVLAWDGWQAPQPTSLYDPATGTFTTIAAPSSIFCSGNVQLPDGRVIVAGGYGQATTGNLGLADTNIFDPATNTWTRVANMNLPRWYPDLTELADGRYVVISGNSSSPSAWADTPEVYDPAANTWTLLSGVSTSQVHEEEYPFSYLLPNGKVFTIGPSEDQSFVLDVGAKTWTPVGTSGVVNGSSVMYRPGKILYSGGAPSVTTTTTASASTSVIDLTAASPTWQKTSPMNTARIYHTLTMLADGRVIAVGGEATSDQTIVTTGVLTTEIWDPASQVWTNDAAIATARNYHATAVLMPDGRVMVAGGGHGDPSTTAGQYSAQYYTPSYLLNGARPTISSAPSGATYGSTFTIGTPDASSIKAVNLVSLGADTHQSDMSQHFVPLSFTAGSGSLTVQAPSAAALAPPGYYMVFILNGSGVPSVASIIKITRTLTVPAAPTGVTATPGDSSARVLWSAPDDGGSVITSYTVTPYLAGVAQAPVTVTGSPAPTQTSVTGLVNGSTYTFTVTATNAIGTGPASAPSNAVTPTPTGGIGFVQQTSGRTSASSLVLTPAQNVSTGDRLVVQVGIWSIGGATAKSVIDAAGNSWTRLTSTIASDGTDLSSWTAPILAGGGSRPAVTVTATGSADIGAGLLEYAGTSTVTGTAVLDVSKTATGTTGSSKATVASGATAAATAGPELAIGLYADSGFGDTLTPGAGWTQRVNVSPTGDMEFLAEDEVVGAGATPSATFGTGPGTPWLAAVIVLRST
ncbi:MAG TPA: fibronectin type III domain-containing protein [Propionibacteriaceae bacterium]|nr:fibronectin type III domain-containing protein [Propionibacteriaceae bacterium]